jgi:hypothetical protein
MEAFPQDVSIMTGTREELDQLAMMFGRKHAGTWSR